MALSSLFEIIDSWKSGRNGGVLSWKNGKNAHFFLGKVAEMI